MPRKASAKSLEYTSIFSFSRSDFLQILKNLHYDYEKFCYIKDRINNYNNYIDLQVTCLSCRSHTHLTKECSYITYKKQLYPYQKEEKIKCEKGTFVRNNRLKYNALHFKEEIEQKSEAFYIENFAFFEQDSPVHTQNTPLLATENAKFRRGSVFSAMIEEKKETIDKKSESLKSAKSSKESLMKGQGSNCETEDVKKTDFDKYSFMLEFEKMKAYDLYFPYNNFNFVVKKLQKIG